MLKIVSTKILKGLKALHVHFFSNIVWLNDNMITIVIVDPSYKSLSNYCCRIKVVYVLYQWIGQLLHFFFKTKTMKKKSSLAFILNKILKRDVLFMEIKTIRFTVYFHIFTSSCQQFKKKCLF